MGTKVKLLLFDETVFDIDTTKFRNDWAKLHAKATDYVIQNFPLNESLIQHTQYFNPRNKTDVKSSKAKPNLALKFGQRFQSVLSCVLCLEPHEKAENLCNKVKTQWKLYHCESEQNLSFNEEMEYHDEKRLKQVCLVIRRMLSKLLISKSRQRYQNNSA